MKRLLDGPSLSSQELSASPRRRAIDDERDAQLAAQGEALSRMGEQLAHLEAELRQQATQQQTAYGEFVHFVRHVRRVRQVIDPLNLWQCLQPRLFQLRQHVPRPLVVPSRYHRARLPVDPPTISLVTPSYNQAAYLPRTMASVFDQKYPRLEYVVQDGGSTDGSADIIARRAARLTRWQSQRDGGQADAINRGFAGTTGAIMGWLNSDDLLLPGALAYVANYFAKHPEVDVVYGHRHIIDARSRQIGSWLLPAHDDALLPWVDYVPQETLFWRREVWERAGGRIDDSFQFALDWDLLLRLRAAGAKMLRLPRFLGAFRVTANTKTSTQLATVGQAEVDRLREQWLGFVPEQDEVAAQAKRYVVRHMWRQLWRLCGVVRD